MNLLDDQLRDHNTGLTIAVFCFILLALPLMYIIPTFFTMWDAQNIEDGTYPESMSLVTGGNPPGSQWVFDLWGYVDELLLILIVWWILNIVQMCCLAIDQVKGKTVMP
jgi:hypothetical protein